MPTLNTNSLFTFQSGLQSAVKMVIGKKHHLFVLPTMRRRLKELVLRLKIPLGLTFHTGRQKTLFLFRVLGTSLRVTGANFL